MNKLHVISQKSSGITLVEILISIVLLGIIAFYIAFSIPISMNVSGSTDKIESTTVLAQKYVEEVKTKVNNDSAFFGTLTEGETPPIPITVSNTDNEKYEISTNIAFENYDENNIPCLARLTVSVYPAGKPESSQKIQVETFLRRNR